MGSWIGVLGVAWIDTAQRPLSILLIDIAGRQSHLRNEAQTGDGIFQACGSLAGISVLPCEQPLFQLARCRPFPTAHPKKLHTRNHCSPLFPIISCPFSLSKPLPSKSSKAAAPTVNRSRRSTRACVTDIHCRSRHNESSAERVTRILIKCLLLRSTLPTPSPRRRRQPQPRRSSRPLLPARTRARSTARAMAPRKVPSSLPPRRRSISGRRKSTSFMPPLFS
jgi:hypothetical protein